MMERDAEAEPYAEVDGEADAFAYDDIVERDAEAEPEADAEAGAEAEPEPEAKEEV